MKLKKLTKAGLVAGAVASLSIAGAGTAWAGTVAWDGVRGLDSITECLPGEEPGLHWIFTPGGTNSVTSATLHLDGATYPGTQAGGGAWHFDTPGDADLGGGAFVDYTGTAGRNALLTISDGCTGEDQPPS
jgi:hypothetical protein